MKLIEILKQLKNIEPDPGYVRSSREVILESTPIVPARTVWQVLAHSFQFGSAVALTGVLLVLVFGAFSTWKFLSPFQIASLDPSDLRAEAQAIDVQIELAKIQYSEPVKTAEAAALPAMPEVLKTKSVAKGVAESEAKSLGIVPPPPTGTSTEIISLDDALNALEN
jgi:hypothetical protein